MFLPKTSEYAQGFGKMPGYRIIWQAYLGSAASVPLPNTPPPHSLCKKELLDDLPQPAVRRIAVLTRGGLLDEIGQPVLVIPR
ncbi:hypothetical protein [Serratia surfactantfaciens]|uniref:hypothetical protein n=1 Tax=Serratia surfactantfaciens TaxID=2741499 RepID=UPI0018E47485|nr:hypothetical protein [Serratia surfactantfaciens]MBI6153651.1 hypothetical protein [Serratia surfactantfaciens]HAY0634946.1 hypothetical protein [Serratia marcescens]